MDDAAEGYDQEGGAERDAMLIQNLKVEEDIWVNQQKLLGPTDVAALPLLYLDDEKHSGGRVEGTVVQGDDGGAMSRKQVAHLPNKQTHGSHYYTFAR